MTAHISAINRCKRQDIDGFKNFSLEQTEKYYFHAAFIMVKGGILK